MKPRPTLRLLAVALLLGCSGGRDSPVAPTSAPADVFTTGNTFSPFSTRITVGMVVRFNIFGGDHNVIFARTIDGGPADINVVRDVIVPRTFGAKGTFAYTCTVHPGMDGEVVVR